MSIKKYYKVIIPIAVVLIVAGIIGSYFIFQKNNVIEPPKGLCGDGICGSLEKANPQLCPQDCPSTSLSLNTAFIAIHMEAGDRALRYAAAQWPVLEELIKTADQYDFKLTLEFNPQWAEYILKDPAKLSKLRGWEKQGHEIAFHHHGPNHGNWNGYTNLEAKKQDPLYIGSMNEAAKLINQLPASGQVLTAGSGNEDTDWLPGVIYDTTGGRDKEDLLSTPIKMVWNGQPVTQISYRMYATTDSANAGLAEIENAYLASSDQIMGIVFHVHDFDQRRAAIEDLFKSLQKNNIEVRTAKDIIATYPTN